jgi:drug/metabolite transporter (DMT)-like permease
VSLAFGVIAALGSAVLYAVGVTLQSIEARQAPSEDSLKPSLLRRLVTRPRWLAGTACVAGGWAMQAVALVLAPITIVQPTLALSVVGLLIIAVRFFDETVRRGEVAAATAIVVGVGGLVLASPGQSEAHAAPLTLAIGMTALAAAALAPYALRGHRRFAMLVVFSAGFAYAWTGLSTKFLADGMSTDAWMVALVWLGATAAAAGVGLLSEMTALQSRSPIRVFPVVLVVQIVVAVLLAPLLAGESWSPDPLVIAALGVSLVVVAAGTRTLAGARSVGRVIADEDDGDGAGPAHHEPECRQRREGDRADHEQRQKQGEDHRWAHGQREGRSPGDEAGGRDGEADEAVAVLDQSEPG